MNISHEGDLYFPGFDKYRKESLKRREEREKYYKWLKLNDPKKYEEEMKIHKKAIKK